MITGFIENIVFMCVQDFVALVSKQSTPTYLNEQRKMFNNIPIAIKAIDVTFQEANLPTGNM